MGQEQHLLDVVRRHEAELPAATVPEESEPAEPSEEEVDNDTPLRLALPTRGVARLPPDVGGPAPLRGNVGPGAGACPSVRRCVKDTQWGP